MKKLKKKSKFTLANDSDEDDKLEVDYEVSDSEQELDEEEKLILKKTRNQLQGGQESDSDDEEEVLGLESSSAEDEEEDEEGEEEDEEEGDSSDEDFDEDEDQDVLGDEDENLPDSKAWGKKRKHFYDTDYVDQDFGGFQNEKDEEAALMEEEEARAIQRRLVEQLDDLDPMLSFATLGDLCKVVDDAEEKKEIIKTDFSQMSERDRLALFEKESPEFSCFVADFQNYLDCVQNNLLNIVNLIKKECLPESSGAQFVLSLTQLIMNFITNISFYLLLKARNRSVKNHPVVKQIMQYKELIKEMEPIYREKIEPQINSVLLKITENGSVADEFSVIKSRKKRKLLDLLSAKNSNNTIKKKKESKKSLVERMEGDENLLDSILGEDAENDSKFEVDQLKNGVTIDQNGEENGEISKRAITYQIAKNKGLTPRRKKENRNPRVKLRNKFHKAKVRRKGQVREVRKEIKKYGGEISGIKASVTKSIKIKS